MLIPPAIGTMETYFFLNRQLRRSRSSSKNLFLMPSVLSWVELKFVCAFRGILVLI